MSACVIWTGAFTSGGYPVRNRRPAHRLAFEAAGHKIPEGHVLHHTCDNKACVNPEHLEAMTPRAHMLLHRNWERSIAARTARTHCKHGHPFDGFRRVNGIVKRYCRTCHNADLRARYYRRRHRLEPKLPKSPQLAYALDVDEAPAPTVPEIAETVAEGSE